MIISALLSLSLAADAAPVVRWGKVRRIASHTSDQGFAVLTDPGTGSATAEIESDVGSESLTLTETDAWLHGAATLAAAPSADAELTLTLYSADGAAVAEIFAYGDGTAESSDPDAVSLSGLAWMEGDASLGLDLTGPDLGDVAYAELTVTETTESEICYAWDKSGTCIKSEVSTTETSETTTVDWDDLGSLWEGTPTLEHTGLQTVKLRTRDEAGKKLGRATLRLGAPLVDGGEGQGTVVIEGDPLTSVAFGVPRKDVDRTCMLTMNICHFLVVSDGWSGGDPLPEIAELALEDGETWSVPTNSVQVTGSAAITSKQMASAAYVGLMLRRDDGSYSSFTLDDDALLSLDAAALPICAEGVCVAVNQGEDGGWDLTATAYGTSVKDLGKGADLWVVPYGPKGEKLDSEAVSVTFEAEAAVVFGLSFDFAADPIGVDVAGTTRLKGPADKKGRRETLVKGRFVAAVTRDTDGDFALGGQDKDLASPRGDILIGGEPIGFELTDVDGDGVIAAPPVVLLHTTGNGKGTRAAATTSNGKPGLL